jgi:hypothetical protein
VPRKNLQTRFNSERTPTDRRLHLWKPAINKSSEALDEDFTIARHWRVALYVRAAPSLRSGN